MGLRPFLPVIALLAAAGSARGGPNSCTSCSPPPPCNCAPTTHQVTVPGVSISTPQINIGLPSIGFGAGAGGASASGAGSASAQAGSSSSVSVSVQTSGSTGSTGSSSQNTAGLIGSFGGGGSGSWTPEAGVSTEIGEVKVEQIAPPPPLAPVCLAWKAMTRQVAVQALCLDDKAVPHPASQVSPERLIAPGYEGEVFRCIAGARMQYTIADYSGQADFTHGQTIACQKGEALYHAANGALQCRPQTPARDCNERSLLRRFGAGVKVMAMSGERVCAQWSQQTVAAAPASTPGPMVLN
jgi:hypothetical protein